MNRSFVIFIDDGRYRIGAGGERITLVDVECPADAPAQVIAQQIMRALEANGYAGSGVTLAIPSSWCLCAAFDTAGLPKKDARQAMLYRLEEQFPVAAEEMVADFVTGEKQAFGVAVQVQALSGLLDALESCGVRVQSICPTSLLALQHEIGNGAADCDGMLRRHGQNLELFLVDRAQPRSWQVLSETTGDVPLALRVATLGRSAPLRLAADPLTPSLRDELAQMPEVEVNEAQRDELDVAAAQAVAAVDHGKLQPWIDLRRDALAPADPNRAIRRPLTFAIAAVVILILCLCLAMAWRGYRYAQFAAEYEQQQQNIFKDLYPTRETPGTLSIPEFLAQEARQITTATGLSTEAPPRPSALLTLYELLSRLPTDVRYQITRLTINDSGIVILGEARSGSDADAFATALRANDGFAVESPPTAATPQGVSFTVAGAAPAPAARPTRPPTTQEARP